MRSEPAVLMAAASSSLTMAISTALIALQKARVAISITASPARAGNEPLNQSSIALPPKSSERSAIHRPRLCYCDKSMI